jgi:E1A-binding protein p400
VNDVLVLQVVLERIKALDSAGNFSATPRVKWPEPERKKTHWDFLLEEAVWLATDFRQERKWKMAMAKKTATMVMKWHAQRVASSQRNLKAEQVKVRKVASMMAREVKKFWAQLEKVRAAKAIGCNCKVMPACRLRCTARS